MKINTEILTDYLNDLCDEKIKLKVEEWIMANSKNRSYFEELQFYWQRECSSKQICVDTDKGYKQFLKKKLARRRSIRIRFIRYAAVITLLISSSVVLYVFQTLPNQVIVENFNQIDKQFTLPDGTVISLVQGGRLEYSKEFEGKERLVHLTGEAFFNVAKNISKPFVVITSCTKTRVVGTSFRIKEDKLNTWVDVKTGIIEFMDIENPTNKVRLIKGDRAEFVNKQNAVLKGKSGYSKDLFKISQLEYTNEKMVNICSDLNNIFNKNIKLNEKYLEQLSLTAKFENQNLDSILETIAYTLNLEIENYNNSILLKNKVNEE